MKLIEFLGAALCFLSEQPSPCGTLQTEKDEKE